MLMAFLYRLGAIHDKTDIVQRKYVLLPLIILQFSYTIPTIVVLLSIRKSDAVYLEFVKEVGVAY